MPLMEKFGYQKKIGAKCLQNEEQKTLEYIKKEKSTSAQYNNVLKLYAKYISFIMLTLKLFIFKTIVVLKVTQCIFYPSLQIFNEPFTTIKLHLLLYITSQTWMNSFIKVEYCINAFLVILHKEVHKFFYRTIVNCNN